MKGNSVVDLLLKHEDEDHQILYLKQPRQGQWREYTWGETVKRARQVACFLQKIGLKKGAHIAIYSKNCAEWFIADFGITLAGMVNVPLFPNQHQESIEYVLEHADVRLVFIGKLDNHLIASGYIPEGIKTASFDYHMDIEVDYGWHEILTCEPVVEVVKPEPDDIYTIIYSSGTSGKPKGAVYTHQAIANYLAIFPKDIQRLTDLEHYHLISYLPLAHVYERSAIQVGSLAIPCDVSFVQSLETFADNLREIEPSVFAAVPRIWGVFKDKIEQKISSGLPKLLLKLPILSMLVKHKIKKQLGLRHCKANISGAAHLPNSIYIFFDKLNIPILEGYGQTENFAYATLSLLDERQMGYVGSPRLQVEIKKDKNNELLMKGPCLMREFYKEPEKTKEALTDDGWLRTGDIVEIDSQNRVKILGRLSENFKNQKGEFIAPTPIEKKFAKNELIENLCLVGEELAANVMVVSLIHHAKDIPRPELKESLHKTLKSINSNLKSYEKISHVLIVEDKWTPENNFLTPTLKVKRREVQSRYQELIQRAIKSSDSVVWE